MCVCMYVWVCGCVFEFSLSTLRRFVNLEPSTLYRTIYTSTVYLSAYVSVSFFFLYTYIEGSNHQLYYYKVSTNVSLYLVVVRFSLTHTHTLTHTLTHSHTHTHSQYGQVAEEEHGSLHPRCLIGAHPRPLSREQTNPDTNFVYITVYCIYPQTPFTINSIYPSKNSRKNTNITDCTCYYSLYVYTTKFCCTI